MVEQYAANCLHRRLSLLSPSVTHCNKTFFVVCFDQFHTLDSYQHTDASSCYQERTCPGHLSCVNTLMSPSASYDSLMKREDKGRLYNTHSISRTNIN